MIELAALALLGCLGLAYLVVTERDLLRAILYTGLFGGLVILAAYTLMAPDIVLAYVAISVALSTGLMVFLVSKTTRKEVV